MLEAARSGRVHLTALRLLAPQLDAANCDSVLAAAAGKTSDEILELVARLAPRAAVATTVRKLPAPRGLTAGSPALALEPSAEAATDPHAGNICSSLPEMPARAAAKVAPLAEDLYRVQLTAPRAFRDKLKQAQDLTGEDVVAVLSAALDLLVERKLKERIGAGKTGPAAIDSDSRYVPAATRRAVWERDGGRCAFIGINGVRCNETRSLQFDHLDGFARTHRHDPSSMRLLCPTHNQFAADALYGREFMEQKRRG